MMTRIKLRAAATLALIALLVAGGAGRPALAQQEEAERLTPEERREAGEFLLSLDARWRDASDFSAVFDDMFVGDAVELSRDNPLGLRPFPFEKGLLAHVSNDELRRAYVASLNFLYLTGRIYLTFEQSKKSKRAAKAVAPADRRPDSDGDGASTEDEAEPSIEEVFSPAILEIFKSSPLFGSFSEENGGVRGASEAEDLKVATPDQLAEWASTMKQAAAKMRERLKELEADLPGGSISAVPREQEGEGEWPDLRLVTLTTPWMNRPAGTRVICGYVSNLHVDLVREGGRYKVLVAHIED